MKRPGFHVSVSPHVHSGYTLQKMMFDTIAALIPVFFAGWFFFGWDAVKIVVACAAVAFITEFLWQKWISPPVRVSNGSAILTGMLLGFLLSTLIPLWLAAVGAFLAIVVGRHLFGGLGNHPFNAALVGWAFVSVSYNALMGDFALPEPAFLMEPGQFLAYPPLQAFKELGAGEVQYVPWRDYLFGNVPGSIGTTSVIAILLGGAYLLYRRIITWHIPLSFIGSAWVFGFIFWQINPEAYANPTFHILTGWLMLGAFFLAPEKGTAPVSGPGMIIYGIGCGVLTIIIRNWGAYFEGVPFAILLMNAAAPLFDKVRTRVVGRVKQIA
jgi:Na+-translocating ferredoxin:NAD+ oxidoreductase subunit D